MDMKYKDMILLSKSKQLRNLLADFNFFIELYNIDEKVECDILTDTAKLALKCLYSELSTVVDVLEK